MSKEKLTDEQIIEQLKNEIHRGEWVDLDFIDCVEVKVLKNALNLINRLKEENAELKAENEKLNREVKALKELYISTTKQATEERDKILAYAENTRKETAEKFAERLKEKLEENSPIAGYDLEDLEFDGETIQECIDETLKEFTE